MVHALRAVLATLGLACAACGLAAGVLVPAPASWRLGAIALALGFGLLAWRRLRWIALALSGVLLGLGLRALPMASNTRDWIDEQAHAPVAALGADGARIEHVRNFRFEPGGAIRRQAWETRSYDPARVRSAWLGVSPFGSIPGAGHAFVSFGFDDGRYLALSVEARRETGEDYDPLAGLFRNYELAYVIGDERDVIGLRTNGWGDEVYLYPLRATPEAMRAAFVDMLGRASGLARAPEFYDTLLNSCSVNLARHANRIVAGLVPASHRLVLAGFSDELALDLGLIDFDGTIEQARARFAVKARAAGDVDSGDFSARIRAADRPSS